MKNWHWKAVDWSGAVKRGVWEAESEQSLFEALRRKSLFLVALRQKRPWPLPWQRWRQGKQYWCKTAQTMASMLAAGLPLLYIIHFLSRQEKDEMLREQWLKAYVQVAAGSSFCRCLTAFEPAPEYFLQVMVSAGEETGKLDQALSEAAAQMAEELSYQSRIKQALTYPLILLAATAVLLCGLDLFILPIYKGFFASWETELPMATRALLAVSGSLPFLLAVLLLGTVWWLLPVAQARKSSLKIWLNESFLLLLPGWKRIRKSRGLQSFCSLWEKMSKAGIPLLTALQLMETMVREKELQALLHDLESAARRGERLSSALADHPYFPAEEAELLAVGEETGSMEKMLSYIAVRFRQKLDQDLNLWQKMMEPLLIGIIACFVGFVAAGLMLPVFELSTHI